jgi:hypothetical protein
MIIFDPNGPRPSLPKGGKKGGILETIIRILTGTIPK